MKNYSLGKIGEDFAANYYESIGFKILERNWHFGKKGEIDIVAIDNNTELMIICEVKTRSRVSAIRPSDSVGLSKQKRIRYLTNAFLSLNPKYLDYYIRFDVAEVVFDKENILFNCIFDAF